MSHETHGDVGRHRTIRRRDALKAGASGVLAAVSAGAASEALAAAGRVSKFGAYQGYSVAAFDGWVRTAIYVPVRDGVKLAVDIYRPTKGGKLHTGRLPVVWQPKRYQRAKIRPDGSLVDTMGGASVDSLELQTAHTLIKHGYVVVSVDRRGTGASFGSRSELSDPKDATDGHDITEWLAKQSWSDGKIGMFGASYEGEMQLRTAGTAPPHLKCIMPEVSPWDWYWVVSPGGVPRKWDFDKMIAGLDTDPNNGPVDADKDHALLKAAIAEHATHNDYSALRNEIPFYDSKNPVSGEQNWMNRHGGHYAPTLVKSGIAVYHITGWFANVTPHQLAWFRNLKGAPQKLLIGPWSAGGARTEDERALCAIEAHRFFDYWLKDVKNGIMAEPAIHSSIPSSHTRALTSWKGLPAVWPLANEQRTEFFFEAGRSGSSKSVNDGKLSRAHPAASGQDDLTVRYDCHYKGGMEPVEAGKTPVDHSDYDAQGLTYTTAPLQHGVEVTGYPVARLWVTSTADDGDFFLKLEDVDPAGASTFVAIGTLRASHRKLGKAPYDTMGLPWISNLAADVTPLEKGKPTELLITFYPTSYLFKPGHRMRVVITGSDLEIAPSPQVSPAPVVSLYRGGGHGSSITLPIIPPHKV